jgi:Mg-chelatase subunit ChlD
VDIASLDQDEAGAVRAVVNVLDPTGRPLPGLTAENMKATLNDAAAPVLNVQAAVNAAFGIDVLLVVDVSGSMGGAPLEQAKAAARSFVEGLAPQDRVAIMTFSDGVRMVQEFSAEKTGAFLALEALTAEGETALYQATADSARASVKSASTRKAIIFLSDGLDNGGGSQISRQDSLSAAQMLGVPAFVIGLGDSTDRSYLTELAQVTGGRLLETPSPEGLIQLYQYMGDFLRSQYVVSIEAAGVDLGEPVKVHLDVFAGGVVGSAERTLEPTIVPSGPPTVTLSGLLPGQEVGSRIRIGVDVASQDPVSTLVFRVDEVNVYQLEEPPYEYELDPQNLAQGPHTLRVEVMTAFGEVGTAEAAFSAVPASGGGLPVYPVLLGVFALAVGGFAVFYLLWRRQQRMARPEARDLPRFSGGGAARPVRVSWDSSKPSAAEIPDESKGVIVVTSGPLTGERFAVASRPVSIGSGHRCAVVLSDEGGQISPEEARVWLRRGRLMVHKLARLSETATEGESGGWSVLDPGDEFQIDGHRFRFEITGVDAEALAQAGDTPSVLRDDSPLNSDQESSTQP